jgi:hypothetical protein
MQNFLKATEVPQTKQQLKKALLNGSIVIFEKDGNRKGDDFKKVEAKEIIDMWSGFSFYPKSQGENVANGYLGTSFFYKFAKA